MDVYPFVEIFFMLNMLFFSFTQQENLKCVIKKKSEAEYDVWITHETNFIWDLNKIPCAANQMKGAIVRIPFSFQDLKMNYWEKYCTSFFFNLFWF